MHFWFGDDEILRDCSTRREHFLSKDTNKQKCTRSRVCVYTCSTLKHLDALVCLTHIYYVFRLNAIPLWVWCMPGTGWYQFLLCHVKYSLTRGFAKWYILHILIHYAVTCIFYKEVIRYSAGLLSVNLSDSLSATFPFTLPLSVWVFLSDTGMFYLGKVHQSAVISPETARELIGITLQTGCSFQDATQR